MPKTAHNAGTRRRTSPAMAFSVKEVAYVVGAPETRIQRAIDRSILPARLETSGGRARRAVAFPALLTHAVMQSVAPSMKLTNAAQVTLLRSLAGVTPEAVKSGAADDIDLEKITVAPSTTMDVGELLRPVLEAVRRVLGSRETVVTDPEIRGGEPVVRGTRVPVYRLADLRAQGVSNAALLEDHPSLTSESLAAALLYTDLHPRVGRPAPPAPWRVKPRISAGSGKAKAKK